MKSTPARPGPRRRRAGRLSRPHAWGAIRAPYDTILVRAGIAKTWINASGEASPARESSAMGGKHAGTCGWIEVKAPNRLPSSKKVTRGGSDPVRVVEVYDLAGSNAVVGGSSAVRPTRQADSGS